ncbi:DUF4932 domain-containing protein [Pedobacter ureilyticus]|uniref:DUF4932 domain-containing protein n=1 Tax=Pedobacter ureilyticus TaxID=1393051 RepID=A0ABW9J4P2_9SPHI|nr:DUF4932 domain-containing protein [Pedobacter helvus]
MKNKITAAITLLCLAFSTPVSSQEKELNFDKSYIKANDKKTTIEINEMQELVYIILSITENGKNPNMVNQKTDYYKDVQQYFTPYATLPVVQKFNSLLTENIINYFILAGNAYGFKFDQNKIVPTQVYNFPAKGVGKFEVKVNPILTYIKDLEEFVERSNYRKFYHEHLPYYNSLKKDYVKFASIALQKKWLENRFNYKINSYRVLTSPLIGGMNATHTFEDNQFKEILLFLPTIKQDQKLSEQLNHAINIRIIFTEIDHNYVGPVSEKFKEKINSIFNDRAKWVNGANKSTDHYPNPIKVYDEYLTWGLFILYAHDNFGSDKELMNQITENINSMMAKKGFPKAKEFNEELLSLYQSAKDKKIENLYTQLLDWSSKQ